MSLNQPDYYSILGVFRDATQDEIKQAYLEAAQRLHPDRNTAAGETELFLHVQQAYEVLSNPKRRSQYDLTLAEKPEEKNKFIRHRVLYSRPSLTYVHEDQLSYVLLEIEPVLKSSNTLSAPPLNLCLVLDRSTSMQGEKMNILKDTAVQLMRNLRPQDVLSIVAFSDRADVIVPASINLDVRKQEDNIRKMQTSGGTEIFHGLEAGLKEIQRTLASDRVNHIIILTDGNTYGDEPQCLKLAEHAAAMNIGITGMGIGHEWNDIFLDALAGKTGGTSVYISRPKDIEHFLVEKFKSLSQVYADEIVLDFRLHRHVTLNFAFRLQPDGGLIEAKSPLQLGPILRDTPLHVLLELIVHPEAVADEKDYLTLLEGQIKTTVKFQPLPTPPIRLSLRRDLQHEPSAEPPPQQILKALSRLTLYRMQERAQRSAQEGDFETAARQLQNLATHLLSQGENSAAKTALLEAHNLESTHAWSKSGVKDIKYQTRALLLGTGKENYL